MYMKLKSWSLNLLLMLVSLTLFALLAESGVRALQRMSIIGVLDRGSVLRPSNQHFAARLVPSKNPILSLEYDLADPAINDFGMRDHEYSVTSVGNVHRVAAIGDSVTFGLGLPLKQTYAKQLERLLNAGRTRGQRFEVMNFGVSGYSTESELELFKVKARQFKPQTVIVGFVMNDVIPTSMLFPAVAAARKEANDFARLAKMSQVLAWVRLKWNQATTAINAVDMYEPYYDLNGDPWKGVVRSLQEFKRLSAVDDFRLIVVIFPMLYDLDQYPFARYHNQLLETLAQLNITHIDLLPEYRAHQPSDLRFMDSDATHPNELGHRIAAERLLQLLRNDISERS